MDKALYYLADQLVEFLGWFDGEWMGPPHVGVCPTKDKAIKAWVKHAKEQEGESRSIPAPPPPREDIDPRCLPKWLNDGLP